MSLRIIALIPIANNTVTRPKNKSLLAGVKENGTRKFIPKMSKVLVLGGPINGTWVDDYGNILIFPEIKPVVSFHLNPEVFERDLPYIEHRYMKRTLTNTDKHKKDVYVHTGISFFEAMNLLREYLLNAFISMEDYE